ncbi:delta(3)-delta(2)-enoyl-CoA isomerase [Malassezia pachydermatis]|uniref:Enoyl-hydratase n=1 Tax=Malassezia pachydermatis TaxID=77020 RepID=A0A0M9VP00_9BASI|nr:enoyl- hydratase [Malassezia pachydermatis]KOS13705.1 enoyl- hydratase [Malassezia pachydermatis]
MPSTTKEYKSTDGTPLVRLEFDEAKRIWVLVMLGKETPDNRMSHVLIKQGILPALRDVRQQWKDWVASEDTGKGAALVTTAEVSNKIFSNGLDLFNAIADPYFFNEYLNAMYYELLTFPIPTVAAVGGHAFAAGSCLAFAHDYRVMNAKRGYICLNEIEFGAKIPRGMYGAIKSVISSKILQRKLILEGHRFSGKEALDFGMVDAVADGAEATLEAAIAMADNLRSRSIKNAWQMNKELIYDDMLSMQFEPMHLTVKL